VQAIPDALVPILTIDARPTYVDEYTPILDEFVGGLAVSYGSLASGDPQPLCWADLSDPAGPLADLVALADVVDGRQGLAELARAMRRRAAASLAALLPAASLHGTQPALMVSCHGIESSLLLVPEFWDEVPSRAAGLGVDLPGDLVVGVPARDVLIVTGSGSEAGLAKARRCVARVFYAADQHLGDPRLVDRRLVGHRPDGDRASHPAAADHRLLSRELLSWDGDRWHVFGAAAPPARGEERWSPPEDRVFRPRPVPRQRAAGRPARQPAVESTPPSIAWPR
jgi:hypothetical protein